MKFTWVFFSDDFWFLSLHLYRSVCSSPPHIGKTYVLLIFYLLLKYISNLCLLSFTQVSTLLLKYRMWMLLPPPAQDARLKWPIARRVKVHVLPEAWMCNVPFFFFLKVPFTGYQVWKAGTTRRDWPPTPMPCASGGSVWGESWTGLLVWWINR